MLFICVYKFVHSNTNLKSLQNFLCFHEFKSFELKCFSYFVFAFQLTHDLFIVVILAHHNNPQSVCGG